jgi:hypothetical protein
LKNGAWDTGWFLALVWLSHSRTQGLKNAAMKIAALACIAHKSLEIFERNRLSAGLLELLSSRGLLYRNA